ncbi:uncharacterized protein LOC142221360 [Haematobia irritans]|uniref:uncharacterized protein LOC142221360 n=1 Tax=Haematobia irritans TaxID=7368 RepID=UPI003F4F4FB8
MVSSKTERNKTNMYSINSSLEQFSNTCEGDDIQNANIPLWPPVSINVINSDNITVCIYSQTLSKSDGISNKQSIGNTECERCENTLRKYSGESEYGLISERLKLSKDIIVNRIDSQHMGGLCSPRQEPYTPESGESHSPCPDLNSSTSTSNSRFSDGEVSLLGTGPFLVANNNQDVLLSEIRRNVGRSNETKYTVGCDDTGRTNRGVVSSQLLKTRLENLRQSSCQNTTKYNDGEVAGDSDVEDIERYCPFCCNID